MQHADGDKERETFPDFSGAHEQDIADQHLFDFFVAFRGAAQQQDRRGRGHDVGNADDRFLRNWLARFPVTEKIAAPSKREAERDGKRGRALQDRVRAGRRRKCQARPSAPSRYR